MHVLENMQQFMEYMSYKLKLWTRLCRSQTWTMIGFGPEGDIYTAGPAFTKDSVCVSTRTFIMVHHKKMSSCWGQGTGHTWDCPMRRVKIVLPNSRKSEPKCSTATPRRISSVWTCPLTVGSAEAPSCSKRPAECYKIVADYRSTQKVI